MKPIRILHIVTKMDFAGLETMLMNYYRNIDRTQVQFDFLTHRLEHGAYDEEIVKLGGKIYYTYPIHPKYFVKYLNFLIYFFSKHKEYCIIHAHIDALSGFCLRAAQLAGVPIRIAHSHSTSFDRNLKYPIRIFAKNLIPRYATNYWGCSASAAHFMFGKYFNKEEKCLVLNNAIDLQKFSFNTAIRKKYRTILNLKEENFVIGHVGRFCYAKNHIFLINIFEQIVQLEPKSILLLVGKGEMETEVRDIVMKKGMENNVLFLGNRPDVAELMQVFDVFLLPSRYEGLPVVGIEAQAVGLPCIFSNTVDRKTNIINSTFISLNKSPHDWAKIAINLKGFTRKLTREYIEEAGYNIVKQAKKLQEIYLNMEKDLQKEQ